MFIQNYDLYDKVDESRTLDMFQKSFHDVGLSLNERKHLHAAHQYTAIRLRGEPTFSGHLRMKQRLILTKWEAMTI